MLIKLRIEYYSDEKIEPTLDDELVNMLAKYGLRQWASGYSFIERVRDISFERENKEA